MEQTSRERAVWAAAESIHALTYFHPSALAAHADAGYRGFWRGYFATRLAPLGPVGPVMGSAHLIGFALPHVARALPEVWALAAPPVAIAARRSGAAAAIRDVVGGDVAQEALAAGRTLVAVLDGVDPAGRPLFAANAALDPPDDPVELLWHATTLLREHRGDGHAAVLLAEGLQGPRAHLLRLAVSGEDPSVLLPHRGWTEHELRAGREELRTRGLLDERGAATAGGRGLLHHVEARTDALAGDPIAALGDRVAPVVAALAVVGRASFDTGVIPVPNAVGVPRP